MEIFKCVNPKFIVYSVQKEDTLASLINKFNIEPQHLVRNNPTLDLYEGEVIKIVKSINTHIVKPMETLTVIAKKYDLNEEDLMIKNNLTNKRVFVGQILNIEK